MFCLRCDHGKLEHSLGSILSLARQALDEETMHRIKSLVAELEQKLREIDE
jgi:hypothetical protein